MMGNPIKKKYIAEPNFQSVSVLSHSDNGQICPFTFGYTQITQGEISIPPEPYMKFSVKNGGAK